MNDLEQAIAELKALGATPQEIEEYVREHAPERAIPAVRPDASAALPRERPNASGDLGAIMRGGLKGHGRVVADEVAPAMAAHVLNATQAVPFARNAQAVAGMMGSKLTDNPMGYQESLAALDEATGEIPADMRAAEQLLGGPAAVKPVGAAIQRTAPVLKAIAKEAVPNKIQRMYRAGQRVANARGKVLPMPAKASVSSPSISPGQTWTQFLKENMGPAMREHGGDHGAAIRALSQRWKGRGVSGPVAPTEAVPPTLEGLLRNPMDEMAEVKRAASLEEALGNPSVVRATERYRTASGALQKGAPKARFEHFAERMAKRQASAPAVEEAAEPTLEDLLALSTQHLKSGGKLEDLIRANPGRRPR